MAKKKTAGSVKKVLHNAKHRAYTQDVRKVIENRTKELKMSGYMLAKLSGLKHQTVYGFINAGRAIRSDKLEKMMDVLGLEIRPKVKR